MFDDNPDHQLRTEELMVGQEVGTKNGASKNGNGSAGVGLGRIESMDPNSAEYISVSKALANCLRHNAAELGLEMGEDGYVSVNELLDHPNFRNISSQLVEKIVVNCPKQRFQLASKPSSSGSDKDSGRLYIRATQGHSIAFIRDELLLSRINDPSELPICLHGTYQNCMPAIMESGLNRMNLNHIHMSISLPESCETILSGMHPDTEVVIEIDVEAAMREGIVFYRSLNGVILSRGVGDSGNIPARFFKSIRDRATGLSEGR